MKTNPFSGEYRKEPARGQSRRFFLEEGVREGIASDDSELFGTRLANEIHQKIKLIRKELIRPDHEPGEEPNIENEVHQYILYVLAHEWQDEKGESKESVVRDLTDADFKTLASAVLNQYDLYTLNVLPKEFWRDPRVRPRLVTEAKQLLKYGSFFDDQHLGALEYLNAGGIAISEVKEEAIACLRLSIRRGDVAQSKTLIDRLKASELEIRISSQDVLEGYRSLLKQDPPNLVGLQELQSITKVKIDPNGYLAEDIDDAFVSYIEYPQSHGESEKQKQILAEITGAKPDWNGRLAKKIERVIWSALGIGGRSIQANPDRALDILRETGAHLEFDAWQQEQIQKIYVQELRDRRVPTERVFELARLLGVKIDPKKQEQTHAALLECTSQIATGKKNVDSIHEESLQVGDELANFDFEWGERERAVLQLKYVHNLRNIRREIGPAFFRDMMANPDVAEFIGGVMADDKQSPGGVRVGALYAEELTGIPFDQLIKRSDAKKLFALGVIFEFNIQNAYTGERNTYLNSIYRKNGGECAEEMSDSHQELVRVGADPVELVKYSEKELPHIFWKEYQKILDVKLDIGNLSALKEMYQKVSPDQAKEWLTEKRACMVSELYIDQVLESRSSAEFDDITFFSIPNAIFKQRAVERLKIGLTDGDVLKKDPDTITRVLSQAGNSESVLEEIRPSIKQGLPKLLASGRMDLVQKWIEFSGVQMERAKTVEEFRSYFSGTNTLRDRAIVIQQFLPTGRERQASLDWLRSTRNPDAQVIPELLQVFGPAVRQEFCPYVNQVPKLIELMPNKEEDMPALVPYVRAFGPQPIPGLFRAFLILEKNRQKSKRGSVGELPAEIQATIDTFLQIHDGSTLEKSASPEKIEGLYKKFQEAIVRLRQDLISDQVPKALDSSLLHMDLLNAMIPVSGKYGSYSDRGDRIAQWRSTVHRLESMEKGHEARVPEGYAVQKFQIGKIGDSSGSLDALLSSNDERERLAAEAEKQEKIRKNIEAEQEKEVFTNFLAPFQKALEEEVATENDPRVFDGLFSRCEMRALDMVLERERMLEKAEGEKNEKKIQGLKIALKKEQTLLEQSRQVQKDFHEKYGNTELRGKLSLTEIAFESLVQVFGKEVHTHAAQEANRLVLLMAKEHAPEHIARIKQAIREKPVGVKVSTEEREAWTTWFEEEALEHLTKPNERPISLAALDAIQKTLRVHNIRESLIATRSVEEKKKAPAHPMCDVVRNIRRLEKQLANGQKNQETATIGYHPVHGLGRVFAADLANACYNQFSFALARNEYPDLHADLLVEEGEGRVDILGSTLWIEGRAKEDKKVLLIRALNPREDVVNRELRADHIVEATIERAITIAKARNMDEVRMCLDHSGGHATNRLAIFQAETNIARKRGYQRAIENLVHTPETSFNGYHVYKAEEAVVVWRKETAMNSEAK